MPRRNNGPRLAQRADGVWEIRYTEGGRSRRYSTGTADRNAAALALGTFLIEQSKAPTVEAADALAQAQTVGWAMGRYMEVHGDKARARQNLDRARRNLTRHMGSVRVAALTAEHADDYTRRRQAEKVSGPTIRNELMSLQAAINLLVKRRELPGNVRPYLPKPAAAEKRPGYLRPEQVQAVLAQARKDAEAGGFTQRRIEYALHIILNTGSRKSAVQHLRRRDVDLAKGTLDLRGYYQTKTKRGALVPISPSLRPWLEKALAEDPHGAPDDLLLGHAGCLTNVFKALGKRAGVTLHPHLLRHTFASLGRQSGVSFDDLAAVLGDSVKTVERVYADHEPETLHRAVAWVGRISGAEPGA